MAGEIRNISEKSRRRGTKSRRQTTGYGSSSYPAASYAAATRGSAALSPGTREKAEASFEVIPGRETVSGGSSMNLGYLLFLAGAAIACVTFCVNYLQLQSKCTALRQENTQLTATLGSLKIENDAAYNRIISDVNLEEVKDIAMNRLGMVYASATQVYYYEETENNYVKQYKDIPGN